MYKLRELRNTVLKETDAYMLSDYPLTEEQRNQMITYRQTLRDLPEVLITNNTVIDMNNLSQYIPSKPF
jgi:hypothetical protein